MNPSDLKQIPLFAELSKQELTQAAHLADEIAVEVGEHLADEGRFAHEFFAIQDGHANVIHNGEFVAKLGPGEFFGEIGLMKTAKRTASVIATTPMKLVVFFGPNFMSLADTMPKVKERIDAAIEARCSAL